MIPAAAAGSDGDGPENRARALRKLLLRLGQMRFGPVPKDLEEAILAISDVQRLEKMIERVIEVSNWEELASN